MKNMLLVKFGWKLGVKNLTATIYFHHLFDVGDWESLTAELNRCVDIYVGS